MNKKYFVTILFFFLFLTACSENNITIPECEWRFTDTMGEQIPVASLQAPYSSVTGNIDNFVNICKPIDLNPLFFKNSKIKTHQIVIGFDAIYPLQKMELTKYTGNKANSVDEISLETSLNGITFKRFFSNRLLEDTLSTIDLNNCSARFIKLIFKAEKNAVYGIQDIKFFLGDGLIVEEAAEWTDAFLRYEEWTGADGIFSFNIEGDDTVGASKNKTGFIFSDTFTGSVNPFNNVRTSNYMINNSVGYYNGAVPVKEGLSFAYRYKENGDPQSAFLPDAYLGYAAANILDNDGLTKYMDKNGLLSNEANGIMWLSPLKEHNYILLDFYDVESLGNLYIWNYNENPLYGIKSFILSYSSDGTNWTYLDEHCINTASGSDGEPYTKEIILNIDARYLKLTIVDTYNENMVGLGKIHITNHLGEPLFADVTAGDYNKTIEGNELTARLWLQDGIVIDDFLYVFPILVKDEDTIFKVTRVGLIKIPLKDNQFDFENAEYLPTPLQSRTGDGGVIYYGAGVMNHVNYDGYVYIYGYKDLDGRFLTVARVKIEEFGNFNRWTYFDGTGWSSDINDSYPIIDKVSPELSVTYMDSGMFTGKYMLVVMEDSTSGRISYAVSDTPYGSFSEYRLLYETSESSYLRGAFTYNAKMHPHLSDEGNYLISYNVNSLILSALQDADIYRPRFIRIIEVKKRENNNEN